MTFDALSGCPSRYHQAENSHGSVFIRKTALVTGASTNGRGRAIAKALARESAAVAVTARRFDSLKKLAAEIKGEGYIEPVVLASNIRRKVKPYFAPISFPVAK